MPDRSNQRFCEMTTKELLISHAVRLGSSFKIGVITVLETDGSQSKGPLCASPMSPCGCEGALCSLWGSL